MDAHPGTAVVLGQIAADDAQPERPQKTQLKKAVRRALG